MRRAALWAALVMLPLIMGAASFGLYPARVIDTEAPPGCAVDLSRSDRLGADGSLTTSAKDSCPECDCCPECLSCCTGTTARASAKKDVCPPCPLCP
jgi:hypothetical protein